MPLDHMPEGNPYREGVAMAEHYRDKISAERPLTAADEVAIGDLLSPTRPTTAQPARDEKETT